MTENEGDLSYEISWQTQESGIRNLQGQPINPHRFYMEDETTRDADSQESPSQLNADDLRHFQQNQAVQGERLYVHQEAGITRDRAAEHCSGFQK